MNERRIVEDTTETQIKEYENFKKDCSEAIGSEPKKKTLIARIIIKFKKKQVAKTEVEYNTEITTDIAKDMNWNKDKTKDDKLSPIPLPETSGEEVLQMKKKNYEEPKVATQTVEDELFSSSENTIFSNELFPENKEDIVKLLKKSIKSGEITKEDRDILVDIYGEEAIQLFEQSL